MVNIKLDLKHTKVLEKNIMEYADTVKNIHDEMHEKASNKREFLGWLDLPTNYDIKEFE